MKRAHFQTFFFPVTLDTPPPPFPLHRDESVVPREGSTKTISPSRYTPHALVSGIGSWPALMGSMPSSCIPWTTETDFCWPNTQIDNYGQLLRPTSQKGAENNCIYSSNVSTSSLTFSGHHFLPPCAVLESKVSGGRGAGSVRRGNLQVQITAWSEITNFSTIRRNHDYNKVWLQERGGFSQSLAGC